MVDLVTTLYVLCWTVTYFECIRLGLRDRTFAMPFFALAFNISWEFLYPILGLLDYYPISNLHASLFLFWGIVDVLILIIYWRFGYNEWILKNSFSRKYFIIWFFLVLVLGLSVNAAILYVIRDGCASVYSSYLINILISALFIDLFLRRNTMKGTSLALAVSKCVGTLLVTILYTFYYRMLFVCVCGTFCFLLDSIYIYLLLTFVHGKISNKD